jgi:hypothetical protein
MRNSFRELTLNSPDIARFRRTRLLVGLGAVAVMLLFGTLVSLTYPGNVDVASDDAVVGRIDRAGIDR